MTKYTYEGTRRILIISGYLGIAFFLFSITGILIGSILHNVHNFSYVGDFPSIQIIIFFWSWFIGIYAVNIYPTVWIDERYLIISNLVFFHVKIPWGDIIDVGVRQPFWGAFGVTLVRARHITLLHRLYGLTFGASLLPSFFIHSEIRKHDELITEIIQRARDAHHLLADE